MSKNFFDDDDDFDVLGDESVSQTHLDARLSRPKPLKDSKNGGISNEAYLNDYRNRMPFHYIESGTDGYYYWQYGATMEIEFEISDEVALTDKTPPYVVGVRADGKNMVDFDTMIAELGSMAAESTESYYTTEQANLMFAAALRLADAAKELAQSALNSVVRIEKDLYSLSGPEYLMSRLVEGTNISIARDLTNPGEPRLKISVAGIGNEAGSLLITEGEGTKEDPFVVTTPSETSDDILSPLSSLVLVFNSLPPAGIPYYPNQEFFVKVRTVAKGENIVPFAVVGIGYNNLEHGVLRNGFYRLMGGKVFDQSNVSHLPYYGPTEGNHYDVEPDKPFMFMRGSNVQLVVNGTTFDSAVCSNVADIDILVLPLVDLPPNCPIIAVYDTTGGEPILTLSFSHLSPTYIEDTVIPHVEKDAKISTKNTSLTERPVRDTDWRQ